MGFRHTAAWQQQLVPVRGLIALTSLPFLFQDFSGGLNTRDSLFLLTDNQARDLSNVQGTTAGAIVKRGGLVTLAQPAATFTSLFALESTTPSLLVGAGGTSLYSVAANGTVTAIKTGLTAGKHWEFISAPVVGGQGPLFGMNGQDTPQRWDGAAGTTSNWTATDSAGAVPNGKYCCYHQNQVFVSGVAANPSRVYWSGIADPTAWNPANLNGSGFEDFDPNDGQPITGLGYVGPYLLVCKPRKLFILVDPASGTSRRLSENLGCTAHRSIAEGAEGTYFLAEDRGVYVTNGSKITPISDVIQPTISAADAAGGSRAQAVGAYFNAHYYLSLPLLSSTNDTTLDFDATLKSWWKHSFGSNQFAIWHPTGSAQLFSAKATGAFVDQCFVATATQDNGQNFPWVWRGPWQSPSFYRRRRFPTPYFRKRLRQLRIDGSGTVDVSLAMNFAGSETLRAANVFNYPQAGGTFGGGGIYGADDGSLFGGPGIISQARLFSLGVANAFSIVFSATSNSPDTVVLYMMAITDRKDLIVA